MIGKQEIFHHLPNVGVSHLALVNIHIVDAKRLESQYLQLDDSARLYVVEEVFLHSEIRLWSPARRHVIFHTLREILGLANVDRRNQSALVAKNPSIKGRFRIGAIKELG